jgi:hypothetical protein
MHGPLTPPIDLQSVVLPRKCAPEEYYQLNLKPNHFLFQFMTIIGHYKYDFGT